MKTAAKMAAAGRSQEVRVFAAFERSAARAEVVAPAASKVASARISADRRCAAFITAVRIRVVAAAPGPYFAKPFEVHSNSHDFGQAPTWTRAGGVLSQEDDRSGIQQVWRSRLDGSHRRCLTCGRLSGSSGFAEERPPGDVP